MVDEREEGFAPEPPPERPRHATREAFALEPDEELIFEASQLLLTNLAIYTKTKPVNSKGSFSNLFSSGSSVSASAPAARTGYQQWKHADGTLISRLDLELIEQVNVASPAETGDSNSARLLISVPRSAVSKKDAGSTDSSAGDAERASLAYRAPDGSSDPAQACRLLQVATSSAARLRWQWRLEASIVAAPEVYSGVHARAYEVPKRGGGAPVPRLLVLSDKSVYSIKREGLTIAFSAPRGRGSGGSYDYWAAGIEGIHTLEQLGGLKQGGKLSGYPYALVMRWRSNSAGWQHATNGDVSGATSRFALKSKHELDTLCACVQATFASLKRGSAVTVVPMKAPGADG